MDFLKVLLESCLTASLTLSWNKFEKPSWRTEINMLCTSVSDCKKKERLIKLTFSNRILQLISLQFDMWRITLSRCFSLGRKYLTVDREQDSCLVLLLFYSVLFYSIFINPETEKQKALCIKLRGHPRKTFNRDK